MLKKLNDVKIQKRLILCFVITVTIASISGILGTVLLIRSDGNYSKALIENGFSQGEIGTFNTYLNKGGAVVRDIVLLTNSVDIQASKDELKGIQEKTNESLVKLRKTCKTPEELELIAIIDEKIPKYRDLRDQVIELGIENKNEEALRLFHSEARPILNETMVAAEGLADLNVSLGQGVSKKLTSQSSLAIVVIIIIIIVSMLVSIIFAIYIAKMFANSINKVKNASLQLAEGDLNINLDVTTKDEIGDMARAFGTASNMMQSYINEISKVLGEVSIGNFDITQEIVYKGDFKEIGGAIDVITKSLSRTLQQINESSAQVALGSNQLSESAQSLAEGATEQAGAVEELTATIESVTATAETSAISANAAYLKAKGFEEEAEKGSEEMEKLSLAMESIDVTSKQIENIITEIEDIASQTNLLSLNASIEAARAGEAGKGFAVVADQIGKLAADSARSAISTRNLIGTSIKEIENGSHITKSTAETLEKVIDGIKLLAKVSQETSALSSTQATTMREIELGIEQISNVVQSNSAAAEETSATSEELSAQSENLKSLVEQFKLKDIDIKY